MDIVAAKNFEGMKHRVVLAHPRNELAQEDLDEIIGFKVSPSASLDTSIVSHHIGNIISDIHEHRVWVSSLVDAR